MNLVHRIVSLFKREPHTLQEIADEQAAEEVRTPVHVGSRDVNDPARLTERHPTR